MPARGVLEVACNGLAAVFSDAFALSDGSAKDRLKRMELSALSLPLRGCSAWVHRATLHSFTSMKQLPYSQKLAPTAALAKAMREAVEDRLRGLEFLLC